MVAKILFLDIDGPMIPGRAYTMPGQTKPLVKTFDPVAVGLLNALCQNKGWRIVLHTSWIRIFGGQETYDHCISQGLKAEYFHKDAWCDETLNWRYTRVAKWLKEHPEVTRYNILDDEPYAADIDVYAAVQENPHPEDMEKHLILVDFYDGIIGSVMDQIGGRGSRGKS
jgi:HAD domain in Swiss Army Knife RNA repair proteins